MKRTQKQLIEDVQQSEKVGKAIAALAIAIDCGEVGFKEQSFLLATIQSEIHFLKNEELESEAS